MHSIIYFSPTGNAKHLAKKLAAELKIPEKKMHALEFTDPNKVESDEHLILLYPVHGFNAPRTVKRFVKALPPGLFKAISLIAVGCNTSWVNKAVSSDLRLSLKKKAYSIVLDETLAMPLTFAMNFPDELNLKLIAESERAISNLAARILAQETSLHKVPFKSKMLNFMGKGESSAARLFGLELHANKNCTSCGTCWNNCPEKNIKEKENGLPGFGFSCSMCMRCIYSCPEKAISPRFSKFIPIKGGYSLSKYITA
jgi:ferredoxin